MLQFSDLEKCLTLFSLKKKGQNGTNTEDQILQACIHVFYAGHVLSFSIYSEN